MAELGKAHAKALLPNFDDMSGEEQVVEVITQETTRLFKRCEKRLQALSQGTEDAKVRQNVQRKLAMQLQNLSVEFRKMQKDYLQKLKQQQDRGPGAAGMDSLGFSTGIGADDEEDYDPGFSDLQLQRVNDAEREVMERDEEVRT